MLSVSMLDLSAFNVSEGQTVVVAQLSEGGFISTRFSVADVTSNNQLLLHGADGGAVRVIFSNAAAHDADVAGNATDWLLLDTTDPLTSNFGIPLAAVFADSGGLIPTTGEAPGEAGSLDGVEGGEIPIASIQSELTSGEESGLGRLPVNTLAAGRSGLQSDQSAELLAASVTSSEITGEWARAIAFEFVGENDVELKRSARNGRSGVTQLSDQAIDGQIDPRLSLHAAQRGERGGGNDTTGAVSHDAAERSDNTPSQNDLSGLSFGIPLFANDALMVASGLAPQLAATIEATRVMALAAAPAVTLGSVTNAAVAEAFSEWSAEGLAARRSVADDRQWDSWGSAPLLLILALERISAGNSRRAQGSGAKDAAPTSVALPRLRAATGADGAV